MIVGVSSIPKKRKGSLKLNSQASRQELISWLLQMLLTESASSKIKLMKWSRTVRYLGLFIKSLVIWSKPIELFLELDLLKTSGLSLKRSI